MTVDDTFMMIIAILCIEKYHAKLTHHRHGLSRHSSLVTRHSSSFLKEERLFLRTDCNYIESGHERMYFLFLRIVQGKSKKIANHRIIGMDYFDGPIIDTSDKNYAC
jgi:hypothetical protein